MVFISAMTWQQDYLNQLAIPPFIQLEACFSLSKQHHWPNAIGLNQLRKAFALTQIPEFIDDSIAANYVEYYEQIIADKSEIPTRSDNWHDLFNGLIWLQFPLTKQYLNQIHMNEISQNGLTPRSKVRDRVTHFDECGVVLVCEDSSVLAALRQHQWRRIFVEHKAKWGREIKVFVFGHAILEMLLKPFLGLTAKWLALDAKEVKGMNGDLHSAPTRAQFHCVDKALCEYLQREDTFSQPRGLLPLPLLGIPGWTDRPQDEAFYANTDYFRPKRPIKTSPTTAR